MTIMAVQIFLKSNISNLYRKIIKEIYHRKSEDKIRRKKLNGIKEARETEEELLTNSWT